MISFVLAEFSGDEGSKMWSFTVLLDDVIDFAHPCWDLRVLIIELSSPVNSTRRFVCLKNMKQIFDLFMTFSPHKFFVKFDLEIVLLFIELNFKDFLLLVLKQVVGDHPSTLSMSLFPLLGGRVVGRNLTKCTLSNLTHCVQPEEVLCKIFFEIKYLINSRKL